MLPADRKFVFIVASIAFAGWAYGQEAKKPVEVWQMHGIATALDDPLKSVWIEALKHVDQSFAKAQGMPVSRIVDLLKDSDRLVRSAAAEALGNMQAKEHVSEVLKLLDDPESIVRGAALRALGNMQATEHLTEIAKLLMAPDYQVRSSAAYALGKMQAKDQAPELVELLKDPNVGLHSSASPLMLLTVRSAVAIALGDMQAKEQDSEVAQLLKDSDRDVRRYAAEALGWMHAKEQAPQLVGLLKDTDYTVRSSAVEALGILPAQEHALDLVTLLKDPNMFVRLAAIKALGNMRVREQAPEVLKLLYDPNMGLRNAAAEALARMQAKEQAPALVKLLTDPDIDVRSAAAEALGDLQARDQASELVALLKAPEPTVRSAGVRALAKMHARDRIPDLVKLLSDPDPQVQFSAADALSYMQSKPQPSQITILLKPAGYDLVSTVRALARMAPLENSIIPELSNVYYSNHARQSEIRFQCYYLTGGKARPLVRQMMLEVDQEPPPLSSIDEAHETLRAFHHVLPPERQSQSAFGDDADKQILRIVQEWKGKWSPDDAVLFSALEKQMDHNSAIALDAVFSIPWWQTAFQYTWKLIAGDLVLWILLVYFYPSSVQVQAFFFWNRWARKFVGLGYVDFALTWIPFLRDRLLAPFREDLIAEARIQDPSLHDYFEDVEAQEADMPGPVLLRSAVPEIRGQIILEGESGLGKSMFLRRLVKTAPSPIAYFSAASCDSGPLQAIQLCLKGKAGDEAFLKSVIYSGGLRIIIDGLNEVTVEAREKILAFLKDSPKAHVLLATQPLLWKRPPKARVLRLLPLAGDRILSFLESRYASFSAPVPVGEQDYKHICQAYIDEVLGPDNSEEDRSAARLVLSNPMDLTTAAQILVRGDKPTLANLQEQQFRLVDADFRRIYQGRHFPLPQFCESVYSRRLADDLSLDAGQFFEAIQVMVEHKLVLEQHGKSAAATATCQWVFRHDKIRDYFLFRAFLDHLGERVPKHLDDARFRGVYLMLASVLPLDQARDLKDALVDRAAQTKDHNLSDAVVEILSNRKPKSIIAIPAP